MTDAKKFLEKLVGPTTIPMLLRAHRTGHDLSQKDMARKLRVSVGYISNIETGKTKLSLGKTIEICKKLGENERFWMAIYFEEEARSVKRNYRVSVEEQSTAKAL